jgi:hypothetical protein
VHRLADRACAELADPPFFQFSCVSGHRRRLCSVSIFSCAGQRTSRPLKLEDMKDNRLGAVALILGAISGMITMSLHPTAGPHPITAAQFEKLRPLMVGVHALVIAGVPVSFLGALALTRRLDAP